MLTDRQRDLIAHFSLARDLDRPDVDDARIDWLLDSMACNDTIPEPEKTLRPDGDGVYSAAFATFDDAASWGETWSCSWDELRAAMVAYVAAREN